MVCYIVNKFILNKKFIKIKIFFKIFSNEISVIIPS